MNSNRERETSLRERTLSGLGWSYLSTFTKALLSLLVLVILARLLTPVDFGLLAIAWIFILLGARFGQSVVGPAIVQRYELTDRHIQVGFTLSMAVGIAIMAIIWLLAPLVGEFFNEPGAARVLQVLSVIFVINGIGVIPVHLLRRNLHFRQLMVADILAYSLGYGLTAVVLAFQGFGVWSLVWGEIMRRVIHTATATWYSPQRLRPGWGLREAADLLSTRGRIFAGPDVRIHCAPGRLLHHRPLAGRRVTRLLLTSRPIDCVAEELRQSEFIRSPVSCHGPASAGQGPSRHHLPARY